MWLARREQAELSARWVPTLSAAEGRMQWAAWSWEQQLAVFSAMTPAHAALWLEVSAPCTPWSLTCWNGLSGAGRSSWQWSAP